MCILVFLCSKLNFIHSFIRLNLFGLLQKHSEKRIKFEQLILYEKRRMDGFRVKETRDVLTLDELKERVETVDELFDILEVSTTKKHKRLLLLHPKTNYTSWVF